MHTEKSIFRCHLQVYIYIDIWMVNVHQQVRVRESGKKKKKKKGCILCMMDRRVFVFKAN
jgi:hypothetical protein